MINRRDLGETDWPIRKTLLPAILGRPPYVVAGPNGVITVDTETVSQIADVMQIAEVMDEIETELMIAALA